VKFFIQFLNTLTKVFDTTLFKWLLRARKMDSTEKKRNLRIARDKARLLCMPTAI